LNLFLSYFRFGLLTIGNQSVFQFNAFNGGRPTVLRPAGDGLVLDLLQGNYP
jgi:hypothetical protein